ncbi:carbohydrate esterase family 4 protein [Mycena galopus ATCC 62051]|nr:carbohydrate esterase family 4 protein [Mycena galopus ATCC 62051]
MLTSAILVGLAACAAARPSSMSPEVESRHEGLVATVYSSCKVKNDVALTFDDGPWIYLNQVVDTLNAAKAIGTFFFNGNNYDCIYHQAAQARVKYAYDHGHMIGSHTWAHLDLTTLPLANITSEMFRVQQALQRITGATPAFTRPPYGNYNNLVLQAATEQQQSLVIWDFEDDDSTGATVAQSEADYDKILAKHPASILTLNHETYKTTAYQVLPYAIAKLKAAGYNLVSLATCLGGVEPYHSVVTPGPADPSWRC